MEKLKEILRDSVLIKWSIFCVMTALVLYILYFVIKNFSRVIESLGLITNNLLAAFSPLLIGLVFAYLLSPLVDKIDQKVMAKLFFRLSSDPIRQARQENLRRLFSILITFLLIIALLVTLLYAFAILIVGNFVFTGVQQMINDVTNYFITYEIAIRNWAESLPQDILSEKINAIIHSATNWFTENVSTASIISFITNLGGGIVNLALGAIVSIYLLKDKAFFSGLWRKFLHLVFSQKNNAILTETLGEINGVFSLFIRGALLDALIVAILSSIGLSLLGLQFAVFIGCFAGLANVIPYFGPVLGMIPAFIVGTFTEGLSHGIIAVVILLVIQQIDANLIYPKVVGSTIGLHPLFVLLSVTVAAYYSGILGMIIAVPCACVIQIFVLKWANWMESRRSAS